MCIVRQEKKLIRYRTPTVARNSNAASGLVSCLGRDASCIRIKAPGLIPSFPVNHSLAFLVFFVFCITLSSCRVLHSTVVEGGLCLCRDNSGHQLKIILVLRRLIA